MSNDKHETQIDRAARRIGWMIVALQILLLAVTSHIAAEIGIFDYTVAANVTVLAQVVFLFSLIGMAWNASPSFRDGTMYHLRGVVDYLR